MQEIEFYPFLKLYRQIFNYRKNTYKLRCIHIHYFIVDLGVLFGFTPGPSYFIGTVFVNLTACREF